VKSILAANSQRQYNHKSSVLEEIMLKFVIESWKRDDLTHEQYIHHLSVQHAEMVRERGHLLGFRKYVQNLRMPSPELEAIGFANGWAEAPSSSVCLWFKDQGELTASFESEEGRKVSADFKEDEERFINPSKVSGFLSLEYCPFDRTVGQANNERQVKTVMQFWRNPAIEPDVFQKTFYEEHGAVVERFAAVLGLTRYTQSHRVPSPEIDGFAGNRGWKPAPDGLIEMYWESKEDFVSKVTSARGKAAFLSLADVERLYTDPARTSAFLSAENIAFDATAQS
jgi:hypothetical protein